MSDLLSREQLLAPGELARAYVKVSAGRAMLRAWSGEERDRYDLETDAIRKAGGETAENLRARVVAHSLIGEDGKQLFLVADEKGRQRIDPAAVAAISQWSGRDLVRAFKAASDLQGFADEDDDEGN